MTTFGSSVRQSFLPGDSRTATMAIKVPRKYARMFCEWLTKEERMAGTIKNYQRYTLPTFKEWKSAAATASVPPDAVTDRIWLPGRYQPTAPVTWGEPNAIGLWCALGNVFEWCLDKRACTSASPCDDPQDDSHASPLPSAVSPCQRTGRCCGPPRIVLRLVE